MVCASLLFTMVVVMLACPVTSQASWYYENWCGIEKDLQYLLDGECAKIFPSSFDRDWTCPVPLRTSAPSGYQIDSSYGDLDIDTTTLGEVITDPDIRACMVITKRVQSKEGGEVSLYNKYMCAGEASANEGYETWSSSKIFAMANAAGHLRSNESSCIPNVAFGLDGTTTGKHGQTPLGDLATVVCSYDTTAAYSSNSLSSYFHDLGWRDRLCNLIQSEWLGYSNFTLGGNYGETTPSDLGFDISADHVSCTADKDPWPTVHDNTISALAEVEMLRRLVLHREVSPDLRFPGALWRDVQNILYGAEESALFPGELWGGMSADIGIFMQTALDLPNLIEHTDTQGLWRIFSKLGDGYSSSRYRAEVVTNNYACIPIYDAASGLVSGGLEVALTVRGSVPDDQGLTSVESKVMDAVNKAVAVALKEAGM